MTIPIGLIVNPIAGMGGTVALKGTDGADTPDEARRRGAVAVAPQRARRFLERLAYRSADIDLLVGAGPMGHADAVAAGWRASVVGGAADATTSAEDTRQLAILMRDRGCRLLVFAGGDGTACDIADAVGGSIPILGIPAGVKMHSGVFATTPAAAAEVVARIASDPRPIDCFDAEVMDIDEAALRQGRLSARLHAIARVPRDRRAIQHPKASGFDDSAALAAAADEIVGAMAAETVYFVGPGTTLGHIKNRLGGGGTLLGVDAERDHSIIGSDLTEAEILALASRHPARIIVGITGGQGFLFGRGNQQFSPSVIRTVGRHSIIIVAGAGKLLALPDGVLRVDTGDPALDAELAGYVRVITGPGRSAMVRISEAF